MELSFDAVNELFDEIQKAQAERDELLAALRSLTNEAKGFISMADSNSHGVTNVRVFQLRIDESTALLKRFEVAGEVKA